VTTWWPRVHHLIGKDILKPHAIYWPTMLHAAGLPVFAGLLVHGFWGLGGGKMSKSVGNVVEALALAERYGHDAFRYFLLREMPFGLDATFSEEALVARLNADLANDLGNLVARATTLMAAREPTAEAVRFQPEDEAVSAAFDVGRERVDRAMEAFEIHRALAEIWQFIGVVNRYVDATQPWALARDPGRQERLDAVLATLGDALSCLGVIVSPFLPTAAARIRQALGDVGPPRLAAALPGRSRRLLRAERLSGLFPKSEAPPVPAPAVAAVSGPEPATGPARVTIEEFSRLDLRVAEVVQAERLPKSKKLLKLTVRMGDETRVLVAGIAEHYPPEALRGRQVVVVANLEPATLMGVTSQGMVLAGSEGAVLALVTTDRPLPAGARVR
jgi:methionyl-tRNA synthetase